MTLAYSVVLESDHLPTNSSLFRLLVLGVKASPVVFSLMTIAFLVLKSGRGS